MTLQKRTTDGALLRFGLAAGGALMRECCCEEDEVDCNDCDPALNASYTVTLSLSDACAEPCNDYTCDDFLDGVAWTVNNTSGCYWSSAPFYNPYTGCWYRMYLWYSGGQWQVRVNNPSMPTCECITSIGLGSTDGCTPAGTYSKVWTINPHGSIGLIPVVS